MSRNLRGIDAQRTVHPVAPDGPFLALIDDLPGAQYLKKFVLPHISGNHPHVLIVVGVFLSLYA